ncbi:nitroreductase family deazaflavin-dependent oxidoreductase [Pseudonocardia sp.]|uniref:nitroreductase family deazaflavin-dependent oxidoreductase n=1 Tax=Pseudonocardia sp. TaxID=60912 RepID=UPI003D0E984B
MTAPALPRWLFPMNKVLVALGRLGVVTGPVRVLTVPGRVSGQPRTTPVTPIVVDGRRYVIAALPDADWARNARAAGRGELARGRRREPVAIRDVDDPEVREAVLRAFPGQAPGGVPFFVRLGLVERADPEQFAALAARVAVFEISPA